MSREFESVSKALAELETELRRVGAPIVAKFRPGLGAEAVQQLTKRLPFRLSEPLATLYEWHDGSAGNGPGEELFPGARFPSLERAVESYFFEVRLAKEVAQAYGLEPVYAEDWFPVFVSVGGDQFVATRGGTGPVIELNRVEPSRNVEQAASLPALYMHLVERYRTGAYTRGSAGHVAVNEGVLARLQRMVRGRGPDVGRLVADLKDPRARNSAAQEIVRYKYPELVEPLIGLLSNPDSEVRREGALLLGAIGDEWAIPHLVRALAEWEGKDRISAWGGLQAIGRAGVIGHLEATLRDGAPELRALAARALGSSQDATAVPALQAATKDRDPRVLRAAESALRMLSAR